MKARQKTRRMPFTLALSAVMYTAVTRNIQVTVLPEFLRERSNPEQNQFFWAYTVEISNHGEADVQLIHRHWTITDANGHVEEVRGPGVVGERPILKPGEIGRAHV